MESIKIQHHTVAPIGALLTVALMAPNLVAGDGCQLLDSPVNPQHTASMTTSESTVVPLRRYVITHSVSTGQLYKIGSHVGLNITDTASESVMSAH